ncbi:CDP-alcohol phosphatidyltransferase family protein [Sphingomicrobium sp. XHP0239]|uniref:CDP-alcohol phosphatidyltransferase family protein n=1 Tax=Sphingomicrobium maritimum TaxID=3133972 RepID=UPI0031CC576F
MSGHSPATDDRPALFVPLGESAQAPFGLDPRMRAYRVAAMAGLDPGTVESLREDGGRGVVIQDMGHVVSPGWLDYIAAHPGHLLVREGRPVLAHARRPAERLEAERLFSSEAVVKAEVFTVIDCEETDLVAVDQRHRPFVALLDEDSDLTEIERALYDAATPRVSDAVTLALLRLPGFEIARAAARAGLTANRITAIGAILSVLAFVAFWQAAFGIGLVLALAYMLADTVDGKLAKVTGTSSLLGRRLDRILGLAHPPFWYIGWMHGVQLGERSLETVYAGFLTLAILTAFALVRGIEALFEARHGFPLSLWRRFDSLFRLIAARRNINILLLGASLVVMRPEWGIQWVAFWSIVTVLVYGVRLSVARGRLLRRIRPTSWLAEHGAEGETR